MSTPELVNPYRDPTSLRAYALIFNGLTGALNDDQWMSLSERARVSQTIYESLRTGGLEVRFVGGLEMLRLAEMEIGPIGGDLP